MHQSLTLCNYEKVLHLMFDRMATDQLSHRSCFQPTRPHRECSGCDLRPSAATCEDWRSWLLLPWQCSVWWSRGPPGTTLEMHPSSTRSSSNATPPSAQSESQSLCMPIGHRQRSFNIHYYSRSSSQHPDDYTCTRVRSAWNITGTSR